MPRSRASETVDRPDFEAQATPRILDSIRAAITKVGREEFLGMAGIDDSSLENILNTTDEYVTVGLVTVACQINKSHNDPDPFHSSVTECLKGTTIRIPQTSVQPRPPAVQGPLQRTRLSPSGSGDMPVGPLFEKKSLRLLGFGVNLVSFFVLGYFLGGIGLSPIIGQPSCIGVSVSPFSLVPCAGSFIGLVISAIGGLVFTYYYFVKRL